jgi:hypothetical protein
VPWASGFSAADLARLPFVVNIFAIGLPEAVRAGRSVAVIIALNEYLAFAPLREADHASPCPAISAPKSPCR